ncbi:hypothetical protein NUW54_g7839 [Trametes sanguinea]|uniref:Uncharacterized protein n=1 Tax=Trametes sanguinea TaxID=158606 RepID=A0ACC1PHK3_9APHY|nr:hypothetical protein NUW54_g7839 [Trametes sanguinea]
MHLRTHLDHRRSSAPYTYTAVLQPLCDDRACGRPELVLLRISVSYTAPRHKKRFSQYSSACTYTRARQQAQRYAPRSMNDLGLLLLDDGRAELEADPEAGEHEEDERDRAQTPPRDY